MELDLEHISGVLSHKILSYLTYEGVAMCENLAICKDDLKPHLRRMHLVVTALREFVQAVEIYSELPSCSKEDKRHLNTLQCRSIFVPFSDGKLFYNCVPLLLIIRPHALRGGTSASFPPFDPVL
jgi:hypothetical protein